MKAALKARADEVASKEEDIAAGEERLRLAESKLHDTKVRPAMSASWGCTWPWWAEA